MQEIRRRLKPNRPVRLSPLGHHYLDPHLPTLVGPQKRAVTFLCELPKTEPKPRQLFMR